MGKTSALATAAGERERSSHINVGGPKVKILGGRQSTIYLGRRVPLNNYHDEEVGSRLAKVWAKFVVMRGGLRNRWCPFARRPRLFEATASATTTYGCGTRTITKQREGGFRQRSGAC